MPYIPFRLQKQGQYTMPESINVSPLSSNLLFLVWRGDTVATPCKISLLPAGTLLGFVGRGHWRTRVSESGARGFSSWLGLLLMVPAAENCIRPQWAVPRSPAPLADCRRALARDPPRELLYRLWAQSHLQPVLFFFFFCPSACRILVPRPGIKPCPLQWKHGVLTTGLPGKSHLLPALIPNLGVLGRSLPNFFLPWVLALGSGDILP